MTRDEYVKLYDDHYKARGLEGAGTGEYERKEQLWKDVGWDKYKLTLDYGCGFGAMAKVCDPDFYRGIDISAEAIKLARQQFPSHSFNVFTIGKLDISPVYDFVAAMSVFTHARYEDVQDCLKDIRNTLSDTGFALIDILEGAERQMVDAFTCRYPLDDFLNELDKAGFTGDKVAEISWSNGFTHTYNETRPQQAAGYQKRLSCSS
jgi:cyclopropane fatty-acyl-phospholipid synthase-like methyltransferase